MNEERKMKNEESLKILDSWFLILHLLGGLAQLARAPALHAGGQRFESVILHLFRKENDL